MTVEGLENEGRACNLACCWRLDLEDRRRLSVVYSSFLSPCCCVAVGANEDASFFKSLGLEDDTAIAVGVKFLTGSGKCDADEAGSDERQVSVVYEFTRAETT